MEISERPWGSYEVILEHSGYKVKKTLSILVVNYRSNHMSIVQNTGLLFLAQQKLLLVKLPKNGRLVVQFL